MHENKNKTKNMQIYKHRKDIEQLTWQSMINLISFSLLIQWTLSIMVRLERTHHE